MAVPRTSWIAALILAVLALGVCAALLRRPPTEPSLPCPPELVRFRDGGEGPPLAYCSDGGAGETPAGAMMAVGGLLDLNQVSEQDLGLIPGVGPQLARTIVQARDARGGFKTWQDVDDVPGMGAAKMELLRSHTELKTDR